MTKFCAKRTNKKIIRDGEGLKLEELLEKFILKLSKSLKLFIFKIQLTNNLV